MINSTDTLRTEMDALENELAAQISLNSNLIRISKERANQKNGLPKNAPGYLVKTSSQYTEKYTLEDYNEDLELFHLGGSIKEYLNKGKTNIHSIKRESVAWKTTIQTPFNASISLKALKSQLNTEFSGTLANLGISKISTTGKFKRWFNNEKKELNGIFRIEYSANYMNGYWEIIIYHTLEIHVPEDLRRPVA